MEDLFYDLNPEQAEAVAATEGCYRIIAGAGTGKTRTLSRRFAYLVNELGILPSNILCVTFTNKAANEMRQRIHALTGDNDTGIISTFHGLCNTILSEESHAVSYPRSFMVMDNSDINDILGRIYEERSVTLRDMTFSKARDMFEMVKLVEKPDYYLDMIRMDLDTLQKKYEESQSVKDILFNGYLYYEKKLFALDYNDLITFTLYIFDQFPDIARKWQQRLEYIMIDEFQDIDELQYKLMKALALVHKNLFIVGDPDQTIYTWRGARLRYLLDFDNDYANVTTIKLTRNYRSTPQILDTANSLIANNTQRIEKRLTAVNETGPKPSCIQLESFAKEGEYIADLIEDMHDTGISYDEIAILYRAHYLSANIEQALMDKKIPYTICSGIQFYDRKEIKDALAWLRMLAWQDDLSFERTVNVPKRNIGKTRMEYLRKEAKATHKTLYETLKLHQDDPLFKNTKAAQYIRLIQDTQTDNRTTSEIFADIMNASGYEVMLRTEGSQERLDNLAQLKQTIHDYENMCGEEAGLEHYLRHAALASSQDTPTGPHQVRLMTIHTAKGLEFDHVIMAGLNETIFPSRKTRTLNAMEEERRLFFVAATRARQTLTMTCAKGQSLQGAPVWPSRFLAEIRPSTLTIKPDASWLDAARVHLSNASRFLAEDDEEVYKPGDRIIHGVFGPGTIISCDGAARTRTIQFDKLATTRTLSQRAKLKREEESDILH